MKQSLRISSAGYCDPRERDRKLGCFDKKLYNFFSTENISCATVCGVVKTCAYTATDCPEPRGVAMCDVLGNPCLINNSDARTNS